MDYLPVGMKMARKRMKKTTKRGSKMDYLAAGMKTVRKKVKQTI